MSSVAFQLTPSNAAASTTFVEQQQVNRGVGAPFTHRVLLLGQYNSGASPTDDQPKRVLTLAQAQSDYGRGSMLARLAEKALLSGAVGYEVWALPLADDNSAQAAEGTIEVTSAPTESGAVHLTIAGDEVDVAVDGTETADETATAIGDAINADADLPVTASVSTATVTVTARWAGESGNQIQMFHNLAESDESPAGLDITIDASLSGGSTNPDVSTALGNLGDTWFSEVVCPYRDDTSVSAVEQAARDRNAPGVKRQFGAFVGWTGTQSALLSELGTAGSRTRNSEWTAYIPVHGSPNTAMEIAASAAGRWARKQAANVGRPVFGDFIPGIRSAQANDLTYSTRDISVKAGASYTMNAGSSVMFGDVCSTRIETNSGVATTKYRFLSDFLPGLQLKINDTEITYGSPPFSQATVIDDGAPGGVPNAVRPKTAKAYAIQLVNRWAQLGLTKNRDDVVDGIVSEIDPTNPGRINVSIPDDFALGLRIMAGLIEWDS